MCFTWSLFLSGRGIRCSLNNANTKVRILKELMRSAILKSICVVILALLCLLPLATRLLPPAAVLKCLAIETTVVHIDLSTARTYSAADIAPYLDYVKRSALEPAEYIVKKFKTKDLVIVSENHWLASHTGFVADLIQPLVASGIRDFAFEFSNVQCQGMINEFLAKPEPDMSLLYGVLSEEYDYFGWPYSGYVNVFLKLHAANQALKKRGDSLFIHLADAPLRVGKSRTGWFRDRHMAAVIGGVLRKNKKVLFYCGATHGITGLVSAKSGKPYPTAGELLHQEFKDRVVSVKLHSFGQDTRPEIFDVPFAGGLFDEILRLYGKPAGFDLVSSPFQKISADLVTDTLLNSSVKENKLTDAWQGYVFPASSNERKFCGVEMEMFRQRFIHRKLARDGFIGTLAWLFFSPQQLADACILYKLQSLGLAQ